MPGELLFSERPCFKLGIQVPYTPYMGLARFEKFLAAGCFVSICRPQNATATCRAVRKDDMYEKDLLNIVWITALKLRLERAQLLVRLCATLKRLHFFVATSEIIRTQPRGCSLAGPYMETRDRPWAHKLLEHLLYSLTMQFRLLEERMHSFRDCFQHPTFEEVDGATFKASVRSNR